MASISLALVLAGCSGAPSGGPQEVVPPADTNLTDTGTTVSVPPTGDTAEPELTPCDTGFPEGPIAPVADGTRWHAVGMGELLGTEIAVADHDGDGLAEILVGAPYSYIGGPSLGRAGAWLLADGAAEGVVDLAATSWYPSGNTTWGEALALMPDTTGDGSPEVIVSGPGTAGWRAFVFEASSHGQVAENDAIAAVAGDVVIEALAIDDITGDAIPELVLAADHDGDGAVYLFSGVPLGDVQIETALSSIIGGVGERAGTSLAATDLDGDGILEILAGAIDDVGPGRVIVIDDPPPGSTFSNEYPVTLEGESSGDSAGVTVAGGDLNGDGYGDIATGDHSIDCSAGRAYLELGPFTGRRYLADADVIVHALGDRDGLGFATSVGDYDGDGQLDWAIGMPRGTPDLPGRVAIFRGPIAPGALDESLADAMLGGPATDDHFGHTLASGDVDGDGIDDLVIGAPEDSTWYPSGGSVTLVLGRSL